MKTQEARQKHWRRTDTENSGGETKDINQEPKHKSLFTPRITGSTPLKIFLIREYQLCFIWKKKKLWLPFERSGRVSKNRGQRSL